ncbi:MAG: AtpZ/AtpI family protein, partial [Pirellulales bacterium]|nr:AtpZ/AtpI family protein [Pirellulales bacterium]
ESEPSSDKSQQETDRPATPRSQKPWGKLAGLGMELAGSTLGLGAVGYLVDWYWNTPNSLGVAIGALLGFALGMFRFIQKAMLEINNQYK